MVNASVTDSASIWISRRTKCGNVSLAQACEKRKPTSLQTDLVPSGKLSADDLSAFAKRIAELLAEDEVDWIRMVIPSRS